MAPHDQPILQSFLNGDAAAVRTIEQWIKSITSFTGWRHLFDEDDIVQDTLVAAYLGLKRGHYKGEGLRAYVARICKNKCVDAIRRHGRSPIQPAADDCDAPDGLPTAEQRLESLQQARFADEVLQQLNQNDRQLLVWLYLDQISRDEIARRLGISDGALRKRIHECLKRVHEVRLRLDRQ